MGGPWRRRAFGRCGKSERELGTQGYGFPGWAVNASMNLTCNLFVSAFVSYIGFREFSLRGSSASTSRALDMACTHLPGLGVFEQVYPVANPLFQTCCSGLLFRIRQLRLVGYIISVRKHFIHD